MKKRAVLISILVVFALPAFASAQSYSYSISGDVTAQKVDGGRLSAQIGASAIITSLSHVGTNGDVLTVVFKAALSAGDKTLLDGLVLSHDPSPDAVDGTTVLQQFTKTPYGMQLDGVAMTAVAGQWVRRDYVLPTDLHVQSAWLDWKNCFEGDHGSLSVIHPAGGSNLQEAASAGATTVNVGPTKAPYYNLAAGAKYIEFWNAAEDELLEIRQITGITATNVNFTPGLAADRDTTVKTKACFGRYNPVRGTTGTDGGFQLQGNGMVYVDNPHSISEKLLKDLILSCRIKTCATVGTRQFLVNFMFRTPK